MTIFINRHFSQQFLILTLAVVVISAISSCGFQLRQGASLPASFGPVSIQGIDKLTNFHKSIRNALRQNAIEIVDDASASHALVIHNYRRDRKVLSVGPGGKVSEYELISTASYQLLDKSGRALYPPESFSISRYYTVSSNQTLSDDLEETDIYERMENALVDRIFRHISANLK